MNQVVSKRDPLKFYATLAFAFGFCCSLGGFVIYFGMAMKRKKGILTAGDTFVICLGGLMILLAFYTIYRYFKNTPVIKVDAEKICVGDRTLYWSEVSSIELSGKQAFQYLFGAEQMEGARFSASDGSVLHMIDHMYSNSWQIKQFVQKVVVEKSTDLAILPLSGTVKPEGNFSLEETFSGSPVISLRGFMFWPFFLCMAFLVIIGVGSNQPGLLVFGIAMGLFWFALNAWLMHYFSVADEYIMVKNHLAFWKKSVYRFDAITEIVFETRYKMPVCLRVITKDFRSVLFPAGTLSTSTWLSLKDKLERSGVTVRNECVR
ncbi:MAG: hypothetical protein IAE95_04680 [Chitinophagaceae bacterium]|nr:hypothetical protein [Chitinophagaceae bacterium]